MSLVPVRYTFTIYQGATFYKRIFFEVEGVLQPLEEHFAELVVKAEPEGEVLKKLTSNGEGIVLGGTQGTIDITFTAAETKNFPKEWGESVVYSLFLTDEQLSPERIDVILRGGIKVIPF